MKCLMFLFLIAPLTVRAEPIQKMLRSMSAGFELGGSIDFMISDQETHANGMGLGSQWGIFAVTNRKGTDWNFKLRLDSVGLHEEAWSNSAVKSLEQDWLMLGFNVENRTDKKNYLYFWEVGIGYGIGGSSEIFMSTSTVDAAVSKLETDTASNFFLSGGVGFKKKYQNRFSIFTSMRTFFIFGKPYSAVQFQGTSLYPIPFLFSLGVEYQL